MFQPYYSKSKYLSRVIYSGMLLIGFFVSSVFLSQTVMGIWVGRICLVLLAFLTMRLLSDLIAKLTGLEFFISLFGMLILFIISTVLSIILGPLYFGFNLIQYFRASEA